MIGIIKSNVFPALGTIQLKESEVKSISLPQRDFRLEVRKYFNYKVLRSHHFLVDQMVLNQLMIGNAIY